MRRTSQLVRWSLGPGGHQSSRWTPYQFLILGTMLAGWLKVCETYSRNTSAMKEVCPGNGTDVKIMCSLCVHCWQNFTYSWKINQKKSPFILFKVQFLGNKYLNNLSKNIHITHRLLYIMFFELFSEAKALSITRGSILVAFSLKINFFPRTENHGRKRVLFTKKIKI